MSHTKGNWEIHREVLNNPQPEYIYGGEDSTHICDFRKLNPLNPNLIDEVLEEQQANAQLIATAPDLLKACKGMLEWARRVKEKNAGMEVFNTEQAIAKAES